MRLVVVTVACSRGLVCELPMKMLLDSTGEEYVPSIEVTDI